MIKKEQWPIFIINVLLILIFGYLSLERENWEFVLYILVIIIFLILILVTNKRKQLSNFVLWGLNGWATLHMFGGFLDINGIRLYELILLDIWKTENFWVLRYNQFVHLWGFVVATLIGYEVLEPYLNKKTNWKVVSVLLVLIGMGLGAFNEIVEFFAVLILPETGVGGYFNTSWDLVFNALGAIIAVIVVNLRRKKNATK